MRVKQKYWSVRRKLLKALVPEFVWRKEAVIDGVALKVRHTPYSFGTKQALQNGMYEAAERQLLRGRVKEGDVIIEMGGSIGVLTAVMSHLTAAAGQVISVEASKTITAYSKQWLEARGNVKVLTGFAFPVYSLNKKIKLHAFDEEAGSLGGTLHFEVLSETGDSQQEGFFDIRKLIQQYNIEPTILVADVEGSERILETVSPMYPSSIRLVLMELHEHLYGAATRDAIINAITGDGFIIKDQLPGVYLFERIQPCSTGVII